MPSLRDYPMDSIEYLQSLTAVREKSHAVLELAKTDKLNHWRLHMDLLPKAVEMIIKLVERDYGPTDRPHLQETISRIAPHGRWRHFGAGNMDRLLGSLGKRHSTPADVTMAVLDLFIVAVLLDAGAGDVWKYVDRQDGNKIYSRSEGLAVATLRMFEEGLFSHDSQGSGPRVTAKGLLALTEDALSRGFQVSAENPLLGLAGRLDLLHRLGEVISSSPNKYFRGGERPGSFFLYLKEKANPDGQVSIDVLWDVVMKGFGGVWPKGRTNFGGVSLGDAWPCDALPEGKRIVPFHKLSQWLAYSLIEPLECLGGLSFSAKERLTGLAEYRNGGLFVDLKIIEMKGRGGSEPSHSDSYEGSSQVVVEWRALTVALLDLVAEELRNRLGVSAELLPLAKILEAGTWKAGREIAKELRGTSGGGPPICIRSDGTLF